MNPKMKLSELRKELTLLLEPCSFEEAEFEADCIIADLLGCTNSVLRIWLNEEMEDVLCENAFCLAKRRLKNEPLQYILGKWEFYSNEFYVGEGVLIPRPETELLVDVAVDTLKNTENPVCFDLCAGSGCIGISVAKAVNNSSVYLLEKSDKAFAYLTKNIAFNSASNCDAVNGDLFEGCKWNIQADLILSNPPYICSDIISTLQPEVQKEPLMALDGGDDGLVFYRALADIWLDSLKTGGTLAVEIGEEQGKTVKCIFNSYFNEIKVIKDYSGLDRVVLAKGKI